MVSSGTVSTAVRFCTGCSCRIRDIVKDLPPLFEGFYANQAARTCPDCGARIRGRPRQKAGQAVVDLPVIIDIHSHFFPALAKAEAEALGPDWPWLRDNGAGRGHIMLGDKEFRPVYDGALVPQPPGGGIGSRQYRCADSVRHADPVRLSEACRPS